MLFYDITLTFGQEVERIWKKRFTGATILWFIVRPLLTPTHKDILRHMNL